MAFILSVGSASTKSHHIGIRRYVVEAVRKGEINKGVCGDQFLVNVGGGVSLR